MSGRICALGAKKHLSDVIVEFKVTHTEIVSKKKGKVEIVQGMYFCMDNIYDPRIEQIIQQ